MVLLLVSANIAITYLNVINDLLISILSFACLPSAPVILILSEPAKSTNSSLDAIYESGFLRSVLSILNSNIEWLLEDYRFNLWLAVILFLLPNLNSCMMSSIDLHWYTNKFSTVNCSRTFQRNFNPFYWVFWLILVKSPNRSNIFSL